MTWERGNEMYAAGLEGLLMCGLERVVTLGVDVVEWFEDDPIP